MDYEVGDTIEYRTLGGSTRVCVVEYRDEDIKDGYPGFDAIMADGDTVWGYDSDIVRVVKKA